VEDAKPTREARVAADQALEDFMQQKTFGNPLPGGYEEQPAEWVEAINCMQTAENRARRVIEQEMEEDAKRKAKEQERKGKRR
jgi:hypothetical protein